MQMRNCGKRRAGVSFVILDLPPRPWDEVPDARLRLVPLDEVRDVRVLPCPKHEGASSRSFHRGRGRVLTASMLAAALIALLPVPAAIADDSAPVVSPDRIEDAPAIKPDPYPDFDNFAWRAFIALNWPSLTDPAHRGVPDRAKTLGDPGARVWETFKARYELFQVGSDGRAIAPKPWAPYEGRINEPEYSALAAHGWSLGQTLPDPAHPAQLPVGSIAVKAAWHPLNAADTPAVRARYYVAENANV